MARYDRIPITPLFDSDFDAEDYIRLTLAGRWSHLPPIVRHFGRGRRIRSLQIKNAYDSVTKDDAADRTFENETRLHK